MRISLAESPGDTYNTKTHNDLPMSDKDQSRRRTPSRLRQIRLCESAPNLKAFFSITQNHNNSVMMPPNEKINYNNTDKLRRGNSLRIPFLGGKFKIYI